MNKSTFAYIKSIVIFPILAVNSIPVGIKLFNVADIKATTEKRVLTIVFSRNEVPKRLVSDNAPEFHLCMVKTYWLHFIQTRPYRPLPNAIAE